jgi:hypothetical protein
MWYRWGPSWARHSASDFAIFWFVIRLTIRLTRDERVTWEIRREEGAAAEPRRVRPHDIRNRRDRRDPDTS